MLPPNEPIESDPPNVWLTSLYGFDPELWGGLGFSIQSNRTYFVRDSEPGALVVIYCTKSSSDKALRGMVVGILEVTHETGDLINYAAPKEWHKEPDYKATAERWKHAVKLTRAWRIAPAHRVAVKDFAPETYSHSRARLIGSRGMRLTSKEARGIFNLTLTETNVFGLPPIEMAAPRSGEQVFT